MTKLVIYRKQGIHKTQHSIHDLSNKRDESSFNRKSYTKIKLTKKECQEYNSSGQKITYFRQKD